VILSDILGVEDALGDMDFKVTGDKEGITAFQMDIKVEGITLDIMRAALLQAKEGRIHILDKMMAVCPISKAQMSAYAPRIETIRINPSKIGTVIGPGGKMIRKISEESGAEINIDDSGIISMSCSTPAGIEKARAMIQSIVAEIEIGKIYDGRVTAIQPFGIFVEILPGKEGLCHISEYDVTRIDKLENYVKVGDTVTVKVLEIDFGKVKLSRKATLVNKPSR
jgi:polyribonucleotide nucleotidyltransferase